jgi:hypothetical protein
MADLLSVFKDYTPPPTDANPMNSLINAYKAGIDIKGSQLEQQALMEKLQRERDLQQQISNLGQLASSGDMNALGNLSALAPQAAKGVMDFTLFRNQQMAQTIRAFNKAPMAVKPEAYEALKRSASDLGIDISAYPAEYSDIAQESLNGALNSLMTLEQQMKEEGESIKNRLNEQRINSELIGQGLDRARIGSEFSRQNVDKARIAKYGAEIEKLGRETTAGGNPNLGSEAVKNLNLANTGLEAINGIKEILQQTGGTVPYFAEDRLIGAKKFQSPRTQQLRVLREDLADVIGRLRSGAAINKTEEERFQSFVPKFSDKPETVEFKLQRLQDMFNELSTNIQGNRQLQSRNNKATEKLEEAKPTASTQKKTKLKKEWLD